MASWRLRFTFGLGLPLVRALAPALALSLGLALIAAPGRAAFAAERGTAPKTSAAPAAQAASGADPSARHGGWQLSADGHTVIDLVNQREWQRCVVGTRWSGLRCIGTPRLLGWAAATEQAHRAEETGKPKSGPAAIPPGPWRLPRAPEVQALLRHLLNDPARFPELFPDTPEDWAWTASPSLRDRQVNPYAYENVMRQRSGGPEIELDVMAATAVHLWTGEVNSRRAKGDRLVVRLVRSLDEPAR